VIMPRTSLRDAGRIADQIRSAIEAKRLVRRSTNETIAPSPSHSAPHSTRPAKPSAS